MSPIRFTHTIITICSLFAATLGICQSALAQAEDATSRKESEETTRLILAELPNWTFQRGAEMPQAMSLQPKSVLRWTNPGTGRVYGDLFLWTVEGRPEVAMSLFKAWEPANGFHVELHSLATVPVSAERAEQRVWQPNSPGINPKPLPQAPTPAETPVRRLSQMKTLAQEFEIKLTDFRVKQDGENQPLRLLPQPHYRYQPSSNELIDGALFVFVLGTDPEVLLMIEDHRSGNSSTWQYGLARMNDNPLVVTRKGEEVWRAVRAAERDELKDPYVLKRLPETAPPTP